MELWNKRVALLTALFFGSLVFCNQPAYAQDEDTANITVTVALAVPGGTSVDPKLGEIHKELTSVFRQSSYEQLDEMQFSLDLGGRQTQSLPGGSQLTVQYTGGSGGMVRLNVQITEDGTTALDTNFSISKGGTIIVGGPPYQNGNLVLAIRTTS